MPEKSMPTTCLREPRIVLLHSRCISYHAASPDPSLLKSVSNFRS
jgi:hypothetical protein